MKRLLIFMLGAVLLASCCASDPSMYKKYEVKLLDGSVEYVRAAYYNSYSGGYVLFGPNKIATYKHFISIREVETRPYERY